MLMVPASLILAGSLATRASSTVALVVALLLELLVLVDSESEPGYLTV